MLQNTPDWATDGVEVGTDCNGAGVGGGAAEVDTL